MPNPILQALQSKASPNQPNNPMDMLKQFSQFKRDMQGKNPQAMVDQLLKSGKMSPQQFEQFKQQAAQFQNLLK